MKLESMTGANFYWYMAGMCRANSSRWISAARDACYPEVKVLYVNWARSDRKEFRRYLKLARMGAL
jgi:hypothetical protein